MKHVAHSFALATAISLGFVGVASANLQINTTDGTTTDTWKTETGQSIPTGTGGYVDGQLVALDPGLYTFTYGPPGLVAGATGFGDSTFINEFWVGANEAAAEALGQVFCTQLGDASCNGAQSIVGDSFTVNLSAGAISFGFEFGPNNSNELLNGNGSDLGAYLAQIGLGTDPNKGPGPVAYLGLSDSPLPDNDFQDLTVRVTEVPEPASLALFGVGLIGLAGIRRRRKALG